MPTQLSFTRLISKLFFYGSGFANSILLPEIITMHCNWIPNSENHYFVQSYIELPSSAFKSYTLIGFCCYWRRSLVLWRSSSSKKQPFQITSTLQKLVPWRMNYDISFGLYYYCQRREFRIGNLSETKQQFGGYTVYIY